ncbi:homeotic protein caudal-like [Pollicipes pollicipes]|uniref:homeotic protein caudal-like n=1 Tax=Pollicipes pollicipes TaxID=41117 RepID=UPI001884FB9F|nr:homeotic protein caudal-like [Pollicipes pollicipes]XP_037073283.1 homeotic protein caudal-like [Pollicipes pollicipes]
MFSQSRDCAGASYNAGFHPMYYHHAQGGGYADLNLPYGGGGGGGALQYPADGYWNNYRTVIGGYDDWHAQGFPARESWEWLDRNSYPSTARPPPGKTRTKDKYRVVYSDAQRLELEKEFRYNNYITIKRKLELSRILGLTDRQVKIWFQNRRAKERKQKRRMEETAKRQLIDLQQQTNSSADMQMNINHSHLQGVHGLLPLHRQTSGAAAGAAEAGRYPRYSVPSGHPMHPEMVAPPHPQQQQQQQQQQPPQQPPPQPHQHHPQQHVVAKSEPREVEPAF